MDADPWLDPLLPLIASHRGGLPVLELGCGEGRDTQVLLAAGYPVVALDLSAEAIEQARRRAPGAEFHCQDLRQPFPVTAGGTRVIVASLSLHYFAWDETLTLARRIHATLPVGGLLLCRLNSTQDHHHGASGHPALEPHYHAVHGQPKRFFDQADVQALFSKGWRTLALEEKVIHRYPQPKVVWEAVLETTTP